MRYLIINYGYLSSLDYEILEEKYNKDVKVVHSRDIEPHRVLQFLLHKDNRVIFLGKRFESSMISLIQMVIEDGNMIKKTGYCDKPSSRVKWFKGNNDGLESLMDSVNERVLPSSVR